MNAYAIGIISSILIYLAIGSYAGRQVRHLDNYYVAGRAAPTLLIVGTLIASFLSTGAFLGETGFAYSGYGAVLLLLIAINSVGYVVGALFFGRYLRRSNALTVAEFFGRRFNSRRVQVIAGLTIIVGLSAYLLAVTQGVSLIISEVTDMSYVASLITVWLGYTLFTLYSGSRGVVITDTVMFLLFTCVAFVALHFIIDASGGWFSSIQSLAINDAKPGIASWHGLTGEGAQWSGTFDAVGWAVIMGVSWAFVVAVSPWQTSRYLMAKNEHTVIRSACVATAVVLGIYLVLASAASVINLSHAELPAESAMIWAAQNLMPLLPGVLLMAGITAAGLSSASTFLSLIGFSASHDLVVFRNVSEQQQLRITRVTMLIVGIIVLPIALWQSPAILNLTYFAGTLFASSWGAVAFMSIWSRRITANAAFWGIIAGFFGNIVPKVLSTVELLSLPVYLDPFVIGLVLSVTTILLLSHQGAVSSEEKVFLEKIHVTPSAELSAEQTRISLRICRYMVRGGIGILIMLWFFYVQPYRATIAMQSSATDADAGGLVLFSGEFMLSVIYSGALVFTGLLARYWLRRAYR